MPAIMNPQRHPETRICYVKLRPELINKIIISVAWSQQRYGKCGSSTSSFQWLFPISSQQPPSCLRLAAGVCCLWVQ